MPQFQIIVNVFGGVVQNVFCSAAIVELIVVNWDDELCDDLQPSDEQIAAPSDAKRTAFVSPCRTARSAARHGR